MVVLKGEISKGLCRLVGNLHTGGAAGSATTSDSNGRQVTGRKRVKFASLTKGGDDLSASS